MEVRIDTRTRVESIPPRAAAHLSIPLLPDRSGEDGRAQIAAEAAQFRIVLQGESRSATLPQLLDFLLERSADVRPPKEIEIAMAVFGKSADFDTSQDSLVRGHMHRLRQRLDSFNAGKSGLRLQIPKGEYRLVLVHGPEDSAEKAPALPESASSLARNKACWAIAIILAASALFWAALFLFGQEHRVASPLGQTAFWTPIAAHERLPLIAVGDFYLVGQSGPEGKMRRLTIRPMIQSGRDLDNYLTLHPDQYSKLHDRDIHRVPAVVATGAATILPLISAMRSDHGVPDIVPVSQVSQERVASSNIIYIEHFPQFGMLRSPILHMSGFAPGKDFDELKDSRSGKLFRARRPESADAPTSQRRDTQSYGYDYGYIASYPGPSGNRILVISGLEDAALAQMVALVSDRRQLDLLAERTRGANAFEALYQVRILGGIVFDTTLLIARPLKTDGSRTSP